MIPVKLAAVAEDCGGRFHRRAGTAVTDEAVRGLETDTRRLSEGEVFAAIKGERVDGPSLAGQALAAGAGGAGLSRLVRETCDVLASVPISRSVESLNAAVTRLA